MRKPTMLLITLVIFTSLVSAGIVTYGNLEFYTISGEKELEILLSDHEGEYFFIFYHSETCPACNYMKTSVFPTQKAEEVLRGINLVSIDVYKGRALTNLQYKVYGKVLVIQPDNVGYYTPKEKGELINVGVPGTPTMVIFKAEKGEKVLKGVAVGALNPEGLEFFVQNSLGDATNSERSSEESQGKDETSSTGNLSLAVLLPILSAGILSVFSPCVLPLIAGTFSLLFAKRKVEVVIAGLVVSFSLLGALAGSLGSYIAQVRGALYLVGGLGFILVGASLISGNINQKLFKFIPSPSERISSKNGYVYDFLLGSALGATWIGCIAPYVGFAVITAALSGSVLKGIIVMGIYGLGMGLTIYLILSSKDFAEWINKKFLSNRLSLTESKKAKWEKILGAVIVLFGVLMLTELTPLRLWSALFEKLAKL
ncbi:cytochrome C-type biogenesis protein (ccdA), conjectural [Thermococcus sp. 2319x1]|uniref:urease accessory protein UreH domain-containing protein n=1 Tax=Thermococcus sp. 2319x1 TaxID=1674923 RepID=UPI00073ACCC0|nr:cytochrome c biogenesis protein CcdA [Thermococcus sp. 2319x1]ALV63537.1 cytochrome C-type biogenesis protein (ccdA), conjectural [Thermococcus sp. 2319x1]